MTNLYLFEYTSDNVPSPETSPDFSQFEIIAADEFFVIVEADNADEVQNEIQIHQYPYWQWTGHPKAGCYVSQSGDSTYIDNDCNVVDSAEAVCRSLGIEFTAFEDCDDILHGLERYF